MKQDEAWNAAKTVLTPLQYETLWLDVVCGLPIKEIARSYGVSNQAIYYRIAGARRKLARHPAFQNMEP